MRKPRTLSELVPTLVAILLAASLVPVAVAADTDHDGWDDSVDNAPRNYNPTQRDMDADGIGDVADSDIDADGLENLLDDYPTRVGSGPFDDDGDTVEDSLDNAPTFVNPDQADTDGDGLGDVVDPDPESPGPLSVVELNGPYVYDPARDDYLLLHAAGTHNYLWTSIGPYAHVSLALDLDNDGQYDDKIQPVTHADDLGIFLSLAELQTHGLDQQGVHTIGLRDAFYATDWADVHTIPEPSTMALLSIGVLGLLACTWRRRMSLR
jgi:hypothetical protein